MIEQNLIQFQASSVIVHQHRCSACGDADRSSIYFAPRFCECPWPGIDAICRERVPGARNPQCPSVNGFGCEDLTAEMQYWTARDAAQRELKQNCADVHFGLTPALGGAIQESEEEARQLGAYFPARGI